MNVRPFTRRIHTRLVAVQCGQCEQWRKPRHIRIPAMVCRDCETTSGFQNWKPIPTPPATPSAVLVSEVTT